MKYSENSELLDSKIMHDNETVSIDEDFSELAEIPEEIEELGVLDESEEELTDTASSAGLYYEALFSSEKNKFNKASVPVLFLTNNLKIHWINETGISFINLETPVENKYIHSVFSPYLNEERMKNIYKSILTDKTGFTWKGKVELSGRDRITSTANMIIFPYFDCKTDSEKPEAYIAYIDDLTEEHNSLLRNTFKSLLDASKLKDDDTGNHVERVNQYSHRIARALYNRPGYEEVDMDFVMNISFLAAMHDVGKIGTPDDILNKPGPLTDMEWDIMREHTINGAFILSSYPNRMAVEIARSHHEKWDGSGYPYNLSGTDIPLSARIVAIADVYDALRMKRVYKEGFSHEKTYSIILEGRGKHFDPDLIDITNEFENELDVLFSKLSDTE